MTDLDDLIVNLRALRHVLLVRTYWMFHELEITVELAEMDWDVRANAIELIDDYARAHVEDFSVSCHFPVPSFEGYRPTPKSSS